MSGSTGALGFGGFFFRSEDPKALAQWYESALGIKQTASDDEQEPWFADSGPLVFQPFEKSSDMFGDAKFSFMLNFRVADLDATVKHLRDMGVTVTVDPETYPYGRFAELKDPEGNPIQLWQPQ
jgi:predicted enzyme related to lactoylglutathione lyase